MADDVVRVLYHVDLWVHVDPNVNEIVSVHIDDWSVRGPVEVSKWTTRPVEDEVRERVLDLVADDASWPVWTIGFDHN